MVDYQGILAKFQQDHVLSCADHEWISDPAFRNVIDDLVDKGFIRKYVNSETFNVEYLMITDKGVDFLILISTESGYFV